MSDITRIGHSGKTLTTDEACVVALRANSKNLKQMLELVDPEERDAKLDGIIKVCVEANEKLAKQMEERIAEQKKGGTLRVTGFRGNPTRLVLSDGREPTITDKLVKALGEL